MAVDNINKYMDSEEDARDFATKPYYIIKFADDGGSPYGNGTVMMVAEMDTLDEAIGKSKQSHLYNIVRKSDGAGYDERTGWMII